MPHCRVARATTRPASSGRACTTPRLIAGLIPAADGPMTGDMRKALDERREMIEARADAVLDTARETGEAWVQHLCEPPRDQPKSLRGDVTGAPLRPTATNTASQMTDRWDRRRSPRRRALTPPVHELLSIEHVASSSKRAMHRSIHRDVRTPSARC